VPVTSEGKAIQDIVAYLRAFLERLDRYGNYESRPWIWRQEKGHGPTVFLCGKDGEGWVDLGTMHLGFADLDGLCLTINNLHHLLNAADALIRIKRCHGCDPDQDSISIAAILSEPSVKAAIDSLRDRQDEASA
jgi:hypothetical protein